MPQVPASRPQAARAKGEARSTPSPPVASIGKIRTLFAPGLIPDGLEWTGVGPEERLKALEFIAAQCRANYDRIRTWKGSYTYHSEEFLHESYVRVAFGSQLKEISSLFRVDDRRMDFAIDMASGNIYRDTRTE